MSAQPPDPEIENLLAELRSVDSLHRQAAAKIIGDRKLRQGEVIQTLKSMRESDPVWSVQDAAQNALVSLDARDGSRQGKGAGSLAVAVILSFLLNAGGAVALLSVWPDQGWLIWIVANLIVVVYFVRARQGKAAAGTLIGFGASFVALWLLLFIALFWGWVSMG